jgi:hypothetical protein
VTVNWWDVVRENLLVGDKQGTKNSPNRDGSATLCRPAGWIPAFAGMTKDYPSVECNFLVAFGLYAFYTVFVDGK